MSSIGKLMKQAQKMQRQMEQVQAELAERTVESTSGGGAVKATAFCDGRLQSIKIDPAAVSSDDVEMLEEMVLTAANNALSEAKEIYNNELGRLTSGMGMPGMM